MALPPLPPTHTLRDELVVAYRGPTNKSNWVVPGLLLCGDRSSLDSHDGLRAILQAGVTTIVCLQARSETKKAVDYRGRATAIRDGTNFVEQPIPDQEITEDHLVGELVDQLLHRMKAGEVLYVHCRGGHGRTGTICSVLLGRLYSLPGPEAMARTQLYHDTRKQPTFCADGYQETADGSSCVILFPSQREQVLRLLAPAFPSAGEPNLARAQSSKYGRGASRYTEHAMEEWKRAGTAAVEALNQGRRLLGGAKGKGEGKGSGGYPANGTAGAVAGHGSDAHDHLREAAHLFWKAAKIRPDFVKGYIGLSQALRLLGEFHEARDALFQGLDREPEDGALLKELKLVEKAAEERHEVAEAIPVEPLADGDAAAAAEEALPVLDWRPTVKQPSVLMLVGLPGCGKSTFAQQLAESGHGWTRLCQDELTGRDAFEDTIGRVAKDTTKKLILDRTNVKKADRKAFLSLAFNPKHAVCVHFDHRPDDCMQRVANRTDHPTIRYGGGQNAVRSMQKDLEVPSTDEGFEEVISLRDFRNANHLLQCWGAEAPEAKPMGFFKFPTTPHVLDLTHGRALTESDRLLSPAEAAQFFNGRNVLIVEEKVDGANLGISLTENWEPRFQNRAKYVSSKYATQWKALDSWWEEHSWEICQLLEPEVEILFGEWVWQRHSVEYTKLPAYFVAFDIYNKRQGRFVSARERDRRLESIGGGIPSVPHLVEGIFNSRGELEQLLSLQSAYGDGPLEGIYLRMDEPVELGGGLWLRQRGKIVRADFIQGIEDGGHFINKEVLRNNLAH